MVSEPEKPDFEEMRNRLLLSLEKLWLNDRYLLENTLHECSLSHRLAVYLEQYMPGWHVDCEFNKDGDKPKLGNGTRPDVIVHCRGAGGPNLFAIEIKKREYTDPLDRSKLDQYVQKLGYRFGACLSLTKEKGAIDWLATGDVTSKCESFTWLNLMEDTHER